MAEDVAKRLLAIKKQIDEAKIEKAQIEGALDQNMKRLKEEFGVSTLKKAKEKLEALKSEQEKFQAKLDRQMEKLEDEHDWE